MEISPPTFLTAYTDGTLQLPCKPYKYKIMKVKWFHNDEEITIDTLKSDEGTLKDGSRKKISILPDGYLEISKIERLVTKLIPKKISNFFRSWNFLWRISWEQILKPTKDPMQEFTDVKSATEKEMLRYERYEEQM